MFFVLALKIALSPTLLNVIVVLPAVKSSHVSPLSVEYSREIDGTSLPIDIAIVEFAYSAVKVR